MARFGKPQTLRTDNEAMFVARWWMRALKTLHIKPRKGPPGQPWRNGRIERVFATLKSVLRHVDWKRTSGIEQVLQEFSIFYNEMRPHQGLGGLTPLQAWQGKTMAEVQAEHAPHRALWLRILMRSKNEPIEYPLRR